MPRAVVFTGPGRPLDLVELPALEPRGTEVLVRVTCCTLCPGDLHIHAGRRLAPTPAVLGHEIVGRIEAFGPDAPRHDAGGTPVTVGSRIIWAGVVGCGSCLACAEDLPQKCLRPWRYGRQRLAPERPLGGGLAEFIVLVPGTTWLRVPDEVSDRAAALASCAVAMAAALLRHAGSLAGRSVLVLGAGVLGVTACAMARAAGAWAVLVSEPLEACRARAMRFGATHAFLEEPELLTTGVRIVTGGHGVDVTLELVGVAESVQAALALVRTGGTVFLAGTVAPLGGVSFDPDSVVRRMLTIRGVHGYHPRDLSTALQLLAGPGRQLPWESLVVADHPLEQAEDAFAYAHAHPGVRLAVCPGPCTSEGRGE